MSNPFDDALQGQAPEKPELSEFWQPSKEGEGIAGRFLKIQTRQFERDKPPSESIVLEPAVIFPVGAAPQGYRRIEININRWLEKLITKNQIGQALAIRYTGSKRTRGGPTPMRTFEVFIMAPSKFSEIAAKHAPGLDDSTEEIPFGEPPF